MYKPSRRDFLRTTAIAGSAALVCWFSPRAFVETALAGTPSAEADSFIPRPVKPGTFSYFTPTEIAFLDAVAGRLIPADTLGPGAHEAGVALFIDQQMAGSYGRAETWYMQGPWQEGSAEQGYQLMLTPAQLYRTAIRNLNDYCQQAFAKRSFAELDAEKQDAILHQLEQGKLQLPEVPAKEFFVMLLQNTVEGFLADPLYGGNRDFIGWKLIGFPGPRYNYSNEIEHYGKPYTLPTVGLLGRAGLPVRHG